MSEEIIGNKEDIVYIGMDKKYHEDYLYICLNGFQTMGTQIRPSVAKKLIPLLEQYLEKTGDK